LTSKRTDLDRPSRAIEVGSFVGAGSLQDTCSTLQDAPQNLVIDLKIEIDTHPSSNMRIANNINRQI
jgi:hypothetical protein